MTLDELKLGQEGTITALEGDDRLTQRLMALGLLEGTRVSILRRALGGDPDEQGDRVLGELNGIEVTLRSGRFGPYVQHGDATEDVPKPPRASLPKTWAPDAMDIEKARLLLELPRQIGLHPEDGQMIEAGLGRFGPYVKHGSTYANLKEVDEVFTIGINRAVDAIAQKAARGAARGATAKPLKEVGDHPDGGAIQVLDGRYGPYVKWEKVNATIPKEADPANVTLEEALVWIAAKAGAKGKKKAAAKPKAASKSKPKAAAKPKAPAKKAPAKKTAAKKVSSTA